MQIKNLKVLVPAAALVIFGCNNANIPDPNNINVSVTPVKTSLTTMASPTPAAVTVSAAPVFENFPESSENSSLEDKYDLREYIDTNKFLDDIPFSAVDNYKVRFTSDGGAVFSIKAQEDSPEYIWKRKPVKLLFDNFQLVNIAQEQDGAKYYSRYSQLIENEISVNNTANTVQNFSKKANLVQTVGISLKKELNSYKIANFTPVIIRQVEKNSLPYKIEKLTLQSENSTAFSIDGEKTLIPWPGLPFDSFANKTLKINVQTSASQPENRNLAVIISLHGSQYQMSKLSANEFATEIKLPSLKAGKNSLIIELIDQSSLQQDTKFQGYTWIVPFITAQ